MYNENHILNKTKGTNYFARYDWWLVVHLIIGNLQQRLRNSLVQSDILLHSVSL